MHIESLKVFCDLAESASFSEAADRNEVSQSAVSQQIRALELKFGVTLIERGPRSFNLTPEGESLLRSARKILAAWDQVDREIRDLQNCVAGNLRLATVYSLGLHELPPHIETYRKRFPDVQLEVVFRSANKVYGEVLDGSVDLGFVPYPQKRKGLLFEIHWKDQLVVICRPDHQLAKLGKIPVSALEGTRFIAFGSDLPTRKAIDAMLRVENIQVQKKIEFDNIESVKRAVELENAVSIVPMESARIEVENGSLVVLEFESGEVYRPLAIVQKRTRARTPAMREFVELLKTHEKL